MDNPNAQAVPETMQPPQLVESDAVAGLALQNSLPRVAAAVPLPAGGPGAPYQPTRGFMLRESILSSCINTYFHMKMMIDHYINIDTRPWNQTTADLIDSFENANVELLGSFNDDFSKIYAPDAVLPSHYAQQLANAAEIFTGEILNLNHSRYPEMLNKTEQFLRSFRCHLHLPPILNSLSQLLKYIVDAKFALILSPTTAVAVLNVIKALVEFEGTCIAMATSPVAPTILNGIFWAAGQQSNELSTLAIEILTQLTNHFLKNDDALKRFQSENFVSFLRQTMALITMHRSEEYAKFLASTLCILKRGVNLGMEEEYQQDQIQWISTHFKTINRDMDAAEVNRKVLNLLSSSSIKEECFYEFFEVFQQLVGEEEDRLEDK